MAKSIDAAQGLDKVAKRIDIAGKALGYIFVVADLYKALQVNNETLRNIRLRRAAIDAADVTSSFYGPIGVIQLTWGISSIFYGAMFGETATALVGSPARAISTLFTYFATNRIPDPIVELVYSLALEALRDQEPSSRASLIISD